MADIALDPFSPALPTSPNRATSGMGSHITDSTCFYHSVFRWYVTIDAVRAFCDIHGVNQPIPWAFIFL